MERMFAKPFIASLEGHVDAVETMARKPETLDIVASGSWDGGLIVHDVSRRRSLFHIEDAHKGKVSGVCFGQQDRLLSCGVDRNIKLWDSHKGYEEDGSGAGPSKRKPISVYPGKAAFNSIDHHRSAAVSNLTIPTSTETVTAVRFNLAEASVLASIGSDRSFTLYDIRTGKAERRIIMQMRSNALSWSPTFPTTVLLASEDHNLYTFDIRSLNTPTQIYKGHVAAVMSCDWCPTGLEFVSGGWDRTVRIWKEGVGTQPEVYHTKRMQRVMSTLYTGDARFVLSGSDDGNVRIWKAHASDKLGIITARERAAIEYRESLKARWKADAEVNKIARTRHLPKPVYKAAQLKRTMLEAQRVKEERRRKHSRAGESKPKAERKKVVIAEQS
ncbi:hypothetical protein BN946_scf184962.g58 [Trametes cinnabarina]|uniref:Sof1-like protein domain-containing protein n=1 Tax=Pycnoporus cinnabarinus TaxID=5643 RepID=A0A060SCM7_PYCCI|nr:hypothetical protein BN946_scf184962.g58 [Trametes cinnabarina]